jgi:phosphatidylethanolamine-binding protein (PEBP) family uncharacterized protein
MTARKCWALCAVVVASSIAAPAFADEAQLKIDFSWAQTERCTAESPKIHVSNVPNGTVRFEVVLQDLDVPTYHHGGGTVVANPNGDIPAGALHEYTGPCPPYGSHTYRFTGNALDGSGDQIGTGSKSALFPSN